MKFLKFLTGLTLVACGALHASESDIKNLKRGIALMELHFDQIASNIKEYNENDNDQLRTIIVSLLELYENVNGSLQRISSVDSSRLINSTVGQNFLDNATKYLNVIELLHKRYKNGGFDFNVPLVIERIELMTRPYAQALKAVS